MRQFVKHSCCCRQSEYFRVLDWDWAWSHLFFLLLWSWKNHPLRLFPSPGSGRHFHCLECQTLSFPADWDEALHQRLSGMHEYSEKTLWILVWPLVLWNFILTPVQRKIAFPGQMETFRQSESLRPAVTWRLFVARKRVDERVHGTFSVYFSRSG